MSKHTPGPWTMLAANHSIYAKDSYPVASASSNRWPEQRLANTHLIAAAPDLLAACERLLMSADASWRGRDVGHDWNAACDEAVAAIAKAKGEQ